MKNKTVVTEFQLKVYDTWCPSELVTYGAGNSDPVIPKWAPGVEYFTSFWDDPNIL